MDVNHYEQLNVDPADLLELTENEITNFMKYKYRLAVKAIHPDINSMIPEDVNLEMAKLREAFEVLRDPDKRYFYNREIGVDMEALRREREKGLIEQEIPDLPNDDIPFGARNIPNGTGVGQKYGPRRADDPAAMFVPAVDIRIEDEFGNPMDAEWKISQSGETYWVAVPKNSQSPNVPPYFITDRANTFAEHFSNMEFRDLSSEFVR